MNPERSKQVEQLYHTEHRGVQNHGAWGYRWRIEKEIAKHAKISEIRENNIFGSSAFNRGPSSTSLKRDDGTHEKNGTHGTKKEDKFE